MCLFCSHMSMQNNTSNIFCFFIIPTELSWVVLGLLSLTNISKFCTFKCKLVVVCLESLIHRAIYRLLLIDKWCLWRILPYIELNKLLISRCRFSNRQLGKTKIHKQANNPWKSKLSKMIP